MDRSIIKLDEDFKNGLGIINPFISGLRTQNYVRLCRLWIDKLIHCAPHERLLRNVYLEQLCRHSQQHVLGPPFNSPPNEGPLQTIPQQFLIKQGVVLDRPVTLACQTEAETTSWSDVSITSGVTSSSWLEEEANHSARKVISSTSTGGETAVTENTHRHRFRHRYKFSQNSLRNKNHRKAKKQTHVDSNEDLVFKDCYETPIRPRSSTSKRKGDKKFKKQMPEGVNSNKSVEYIKETKGGGNTVRKKVPKSKSAKEAVVPESEEAEKPVEMKENIARKSAHKTSVVTVEVDEDKVKKVDDDKGRKIDKEKIIELEKKVSDIKKENDILCEQLIQEKSQKDEMSVLQDALKKEVFDLKDKLILVEKMKSALEGEHKEVVNGIMNTLSVLSARVNTAIAKNDQLESLIMTMSNDIKEMESSNSDALQQVRKEYSTKKKTLEQEYNDKLQETKSAHVLQIQSYENSVADLKKEISKKNKEVLRLEKQLQDHCSRMKTEVENIKQEMEKSSKECEIELKAKITSYKSKIIKLIKHNKKMAECYEQKINVLNKSKDMELWVQRLSIGSKLTNGKKQELETIVSALEEKFRKQLTNATQITFNVEPNIKCYEKVPELENTNENNHVIEQQPG